MKDVLSFEDLARMHSLSLLRWDSDNYASENTQLAHDFYKAGQQSKQAEVDVLRKQIEKALDHTINHGGYDDLTQIIKILRGGENED